MSDTKLTEPERDQMAHAIGHQSSKSCSVHGGRNHFVTAADDELWLGLVDLGLARTRTSSLLDSSEAVFTVTAEGRAAVEADPRSKPVGRRYTVLFRGAPECPITVLAETRSKARYAAVLRVSDAWDMTAAEGFARVASCRLAS